MFKNYFLVAFRSVLRQRGYSLINILGLSIGMASAILIFLYVTDELTYDTMHPEAENTFRMGYHVEFPNGNSQTYPGSPAGWDNYLKDNYPSVTNVTSFVWYGYPTSIQDRDTDKILLTEEIIWVEPNFGEIVFMDIIKGNSELALSEQNSIVLSESAAKELFGEEDPINKIISITHVFATQGKRLDLMVTGVMRDMPSNSHIRPKYIANIFALKPFNENLETIDSYMGDLNVPGMFTQSMFVCENPDDIEIISKDLEERAKKISETAQVEFTFRPLFRKITDVHFDQEIDWAVTHKATNRQYMMVFITVALLILVIASINYMNLATAQSTKRAKEVGLRKTLGSTRQQMFWQFIMESFILVAFSTFVSIILVLIALPQFNQLAVKSFTFTHLLNPNMMWILLGVMLFVTFVAGSYPALYISGFQPAVVLKGTVTFGKGANFFRRFLTSIQFAISIILVISSVFIVRQMNMMQYSKLNESDEQIISVRYGGFSGNDATINKYNTYKNILLSYPNIESVTLANHLPRLDYFGVLGFNYQFPEVSEDNYTFDRLSGDFDFPMTFNMEIIAGRTFESANVSDSSAVLLNEAALKSLGITANEAIDLAIKTPSFNPDYQGHVIGVVKDFPYQSMYHEIKPLVISPHPAGMDRIIHIKVSTSNMGESLALIEEKWKEIYPEYGFDNWFINDEFARMYENEKQIASLTEKFSILAILITCVGLYGMASFMATQKTKEIGIRKAMGATVSQITGLLLIIFIKLLGIASIVGIPVAFLISQKWLSTFVYRTELSVWVFAGAMLGIVAVTILTVSFETIKAARTNPVRALRQNN